MGRITSGMKASLCRIIGTIAVAMLLGSCTPELDIRALVEKEVILAKIGLTLYDGTTKVLPGDTVTWSDTIFGDPLTKTLTLKNDGSKNITLTGPSIVVKAGGTGVAAYGNIVQPGTLTLLPGASTTFTIDYTPPAADSDYTCDFVVNSNDDSYPAYSFKGTGHSTQWHGSKAIVSSTTTFYSSPQIAIDSSTSPATIYVTYMDSGIQYVKSVDGGKTWTSPTQILAAAYYYSFAVANGALHIFYMNTSTSPSTLQYAKLPYGYVSWQNIKSFSANTSYYGISNSSVVLANGNVYLVFDDTTNNKLEVSMSMDLAPAYMSFTTHDVTGGSTGKTGGFYPSLRFVGTTAYLSYLDSKTSMIAYGSSLSSWTYKTIYTDATYNMGANALAVNGSNATLLLAYNGNTLYRAASTTLGGTNSWSSPIAFGTESCNLSQNLPIVYSGSDLCTLFYKNSSTSGIRFAKSSDNGATWDYQWLDTDVGSAGDSCALAVSARAVYALYSTPSPNYSITLKKSLDGGASW